MPSEDDAFVNGTTGGTFAPMPRRDNISKLQLFIQRRELAPMSMKGKKPGASELPIYSDIKVTGPSHEPEFTVQVALNALCRNDELDSWEYEKKEATGSGPTKQAARQNAAAAMLVLLGVE